MKKALIVLNGRSIAKNKISKIIDNNTAIYAVDGGANHLFELGIEPNILIGDMDSIDAKILDRAVQKGVEIIKHSPEKDQTDSELAVEHAIENGAKEIIIAGFDGDRFDHMLANIHYFSKLVSELIIKIIQNKTDIYFVDRSLTFNGAIGEEVSIIPMKQDAIGVRTEGLKYKLHEETLLFASTRGVSNVIVSNKVTICVKEGVLCVIHNQELPKKGLR
ncbi:MAG: thiamine diphosphokinase [Candidatus Roizmanbacteria bacterium]|nr:thiamine diphosphokinase [Candidatus Roizmanbacteria bacterium]